MTWAGKPDVKPGFYPGGREIEAILDQIELLTSPPRAQLRQTSGQSIPNTTFTAVLFDTEDFDNYSGHSTSTNTSRYTAQVAGWYRLSGKIGWIGNATGRRASAWHLNGTVIAGSQVAHIATSASDVEHLTAPIDVLMAVGDYVEMMAYQESGGALSTIVSFAGLYSYMNVRWIGE